MPIGLKTSVTMPSLTMALTARLDGQLDRAYVGELVAAQTLSRGGYAEQVFRTLNHIARLNPLWPYIEAHAAEYRAALASPFCRPLTLAATMAAAYPLLYDALATAGRYFRAQDELTLATLRRQLCQTYAPSVSTEKAIHHAMKMLVEAGMMARERPGVYVIRRQSQAQPFARELYRQAFLLHNPMDERDDEQLLRHPYFEYIH